MPVDGEGYIPCQRERWIWMETNGLTRMYMLRYVREDPSWVLTGADPNLMVGVRLVSGL